MGKLTSLHLDLLFCTHTHSISTFISQIPYFLLLKYHICYFYVVFFSIQIVGGVCVGGWLGGGGVSRYNMVQYDTYSIVDTNTTPKLHIDQTRGGGYYTL